jgi:hypothetical protein
MRIIASRDAFMRNLPTGCEFYGKWPERYDVEPGYLFSVRTRDREIQAWATDKPGKYDRFDVIEYEYNTETNQYDVPAGHDHDQYFPMALHLVRTKAEAAA